MMDKKGFYDHLRQMPNPHPEGETKGSLAEFNRYAGQMARQALETTGVEHMIEEEPPRYAETKPDLGSNQVTPREKKEI